MHYVKELSVVDRALIQMGCIWQCLGLIMCTASGGGMRKEMGLTTLHVPRYKPVSVHQNKIADYLPHVWARVKLI